MKLPLVTSYSNLQLRLGYLKIVSALGTRFPTAQTVFEDKLAKLFPAPLPKKGQALGLAAKKQATPSSYIEHQFEDLGVRRGILNKKNVSEIVTLAKAFEFINPHNCSLYEIAVVVQAVMGKRAMTAVVDQSADTYNPLIIGGSAGDIMEKALFTILTLRADLATALLACAVADRTTSFHLYEGFPSPGTPLKAGLNAVMTDKSAKKTVFKFPSSETKLEAGVNAVANFKNRKKSTFNRDRGDFKGGGTLTPYSKDSLLLIMFRLVEKSVVELRAGALSISNWKEWQEYFLGELTASPFGGEPIYRMGKRSSYRHHAAPRLEFLVDLGLLQRDSDGIRNNVNDGDDGDSDYAYRANASTQRFADYVKTHLQPNLDVDKFVRERAIDCCAKSHNLTLTSATESEKVGFLVKGFQQVNRDIGSTPMWTTALMSSLLALRQNIKIEISDFYALAKKLSLAEAAKVRLSGGSRFDGEFLISIAPEFLKASLREGNLTL
jgi:hypothetical protein